MPFRSVQYNAARQGKRGPTVGAAWPPGLAVFVIALAGTWGVSGCDRQMVFRSPAREHAVDAPPTTHRPVAKPKVNREVRVLLLEGIRTARLSVYSPFKLEDRDGRPIGSGQARGLHSAVARISAARPPVFHLGAFKTTSPIVNVLPMTSGAVELAVPDGAGKLKPRRYRGSLRIHIRPGGTADVVNVVDMEEYLAGVLCGELPRRFNIDAFKAQAIAARTYAFYQKAVGGRSRHWDVKATESSQMYLGIEGEKRSSKALTAVAETAGQVCTWDSPRGHKIFCTYYSSTCGGLTQNVVNVKGNDAYAPPLAGGVRCPYCRNAKYYRWGEVKLSKKYVTERLFRKESFAHLRPLEFIRDMRISAATKEGRPVWFSLLGVGGRTAEIRAEDFRLLMGGHTLKSTDFSLRSEPDRFVFYNGKGFGHGLGLCQYGAQGMAQAGHGPKDILAFYYPGCIIESAYH